MTCQAADRWWRQCPGCGRQRRLTQDGTMCDHNRWDSAAWAMVPCEGSGRPPGPLPAPRTAPGHLEAAGVPGLVRGQR